MILQNGTMVAGRYQIIEKIGAGGMSDVYKAKDLKLGRYVAVKVLKEEFNNDMSFVTKFRTEAQSAAGLEHPNIVNVYDVGSETGYHYIIMEYVEGITLKDYISKKHRLNYKETLSIAIQVSRGIEAAHEKGIIHRDIKPQNIIISMDGKVKVTDFGIARAASENTIHSDVMGSVHYTSPEQARNGYVTEKSDIYSLGIVMYEMTTGHVPFDGESTVQIAIQHLQDEIVAPSAYAPDIPISLEKIILKCTQKSQDRRYDSMENLLIDLRKALISPNEDFVTDIPVTSKTRVISDSELNDIQERAHESDRIEDAIFDDEEDDEGEGRFLNPRMERIVTIAGIIAAIIIVLIVVLLLGNVMGLFHLGSGKNNDSGAAVVSVVSEESKESTTMIDLRGMTVSKAESELNKIGLSLNQSGTQASSEYEEGQIISQDIKEGETVEAGTTINVVVSSGDSVEKTEVPDVTGKSSSDAESELEEAKLLVTKEYEYSDDVEAGDVIRQSPKAGKEVNEGDTVTIYVSQGEKNVEVPDVKGDSQEDATDALKSAGFKVKVKTQHSESVDKGKVIRQDLTAGSYEPSGSTVTITVSEGPETKYYSYSAKVNAPSNVEVTYANIQLMASDGETVIKRWSKVTDFPYEISVSKIKDETNGTLVITWHFLDEDGNADTDVQEEDVTFK